MSAEHLVEVGVPKQLRQRSPAGFLNALSQAVRRVWSDLNLPSRPRVALTDGVAGSVVIGGRLMPVSARRIEQAVLAGSGAARRPGEVGTPRELLMERVQSSDPATAARVLACLVDATLRADIVSLIRADSPAIARQLMTAHGKGAPPREVVAEAITLTAEHGVVPPPLAGAGDPLADGAGQMPDALSERLTRAWLADTPPQPVIEAHASTLRRLTTGESGLRRQQIAMEGSRGLMDDLFLDYGVRPPPPVMLRSAEEPETVVRFRFGRNRTAAHLVLPSNQAVMTIHPDRLPPGTSARPFVDPAYGGIWSLVELPLDPTQPREIVLDPAGLVIRGLLAEMRTRLALWSPSWDQLPAFDWAWADSDLLHLDMASAALRWLLSAQGSVHLLARLMEGVVAAAAEGVTGPAAIATQLRSCLGKAVLGPLAATADLYTPVEVDDALVRGAAKAGSAAPLLERHQLLTEATGQLVVSCPGQVRREAERLLRPLNDVVVVAADEELARLPCAAH